MADRVYAVVRHRGSVLGCGGGKATEPVTLPSAPVAGQSSAAMRSLLVDLGLAGASIERRADVEDAAVWLVSAPDRDVTIARPCVDPTWAPPAELFDPDGDDWRLYRSVAPTVETLRSDRERGSSAVAIDALWVLRDAAAAAEGLDAVRSVAERLLAARPAMAALTNRVNRAMAGADTPAAVSTAATEGINSAHEADEAAAELAARTVEGERVLTLSRSGTVRTALLAARPAVEILVSLPGAEGRAVAETLTQSGLSVTVVPDARVYDRLRSGAIDTVLVGVDVVDPDGGVWNKVGTRAAGLAAELGGVPFYAVCSSDKVRAAVDGRAVDRAHDPLFDLTPPRLVTAVLTERGRLSRGAVGEIAAEHRRLARWQSGPT